MENQDGISSDAIDQMSLEEFEKEIVNSLVGMYSAQTAEERNQLYRNICMLSENKAKFIQGVVQALYGDYELTQKLSVVLYFKSYLNNMIIKKILSADERKEVFNEFLKVIFEADLPVEIRNNLTPCLESLLFADENDRENSQHLLEHLFETMDRYIGTDPSSQESKILRVFFSLFRASINIIQDSTLISERLRGSIKFLCSSASKIIEELKDAFTNGNQLEAKQNSAALQEWVMIFKESLNKTQKAINYPTLPEAERKSAGLSYIDFLTREDFMKVSYEIIFLATPEDRLFFTTGDEKIDNLLFNAKENIIKIIGNLISYIKPHLHMKALENTDFLKLLQVITPLFLESLIELGSEEENAKFLSSAHRCQLISSVLSCSSQLVYIKEFHPIFEKYSLRIFTDIGFPFLRTLEEERNEAIDNPSEFVKLGLDTCDRQRLAHMKSQAARFIETMGDKLRGYFPQLCNLCCDMLDYSVLKEQGLDGNSNADELAQNYPTLKDNFEESRFFKYCSNEDMMDVSIMVLTMISYALPKNEALKKRFTEVLEKTTKPIMDKKDLILNCRLTCLLGYYIDILYKDQPDVFNSVIKMFITSLNQQEETLALTYQSSDTLNTIINDNDIVPRMRPIINDVLTYIYDAVLVVKIPEFFDFLEEIFKFYKSELNTESVVKCVECLVARIENDLINNRGECGDVNPFKQFAPGRSNVENNEKHENTIAIQKSWVVIMRVLETEEYINQAGDQLLEKLKFMFGNLAEPKRIDFDDDIVKSMKILINSSKAVAEEMKVLFPYLENTFKKNGYVYGELFDLIKAYIKNDKAFILSNEQCLQTLFGFGITTLYHEQHVINGVIYLMQLILLLKDDQNHATDALIPDTLKEIFKRMQQQPMNSVMKRVMFLPILACMVGNFSATFTYFEQNDMTEQVVNQILKNSSKTFECPLERKLYAMTMTSLLTQQELPGCVREKSPQIITKIAHCLIKTTVEEVKEAKSKEKKKLDYLSDSDYSDSEYESSESDLSENEEESKRRQDSILALIDENDDNEGGDKDDSTDNDENDGDVIETTIDVQSNFAVMKTGFNSFDEFNYFKFVWKQLSQNHPQEMQALASNLSEKTQKAIRNLCQVQHFETNGRVVHRRIIKGKRKQ